jgi:essential nuclear protein 1
MNQAWYLYLALKWSARDTHDSSTSSIYGVDAGFQRRNLADMIMDKIREKEAQEGEHSDGDAMQEEAAEDASAQLPPKVIEVYTAIGKLLSHYTAGTLPKAFKIIPSLSNWEQILYLTAPDNWSTHAVYAATRIFASNLNPHMAQRFYNIFLLERCR